MEKETKEKLKIYRIMELKKFRNKYDLELIPASYSGIINGTLVWDPFIGKPDFEHPGMPNHIFNAFLDADLLNQEEFSGALNELENEELDDAHFAERVIDVDLNIATSLENPQLGEIGHNFELKSIKKFTFGELKARVMSNLMRVRIDDFLEELKKNKWERYDGKIRRVFMITELYYGSMKLVIENSLKNEFNATINQSGLEIKNELELGKSVEYTFEHQNVPFAMRLEKVREFNG